MPYDPDNPPDKVSHLSEKKQRQWVHVYNSARGRGADEESAHKQAWGAVKKEVDSGEVLQALKTFCALLEKAPPVDFGGARGSMGQDPSQWHEIPSEPGYMRRVLPGGKVERKKKSELGKKPEKKPGKKPGAKRSKYENLPSPTGYSEAKIDPKTGKLVATGKTGRGKALPRVVIDLDDPNLDQKLPSEWKRHLRRIASDLNLDEHFEHLRKAALRDLELFSMSVSGRLEKQGEEQKEPETVDVSTPQGARSMALGLTRLFGGWKGGCRLSPSANRVDTYHITVFCESPEELGQRILDLKQHLISRGYKEESEGIFRQGNKTVFQGRSYSRRKGKRPLAFMITVRERSK